MAGRWFYRLFNEEFGPIVEDQVVELIRSQVLTGSDAIRSEDSGLWQTVSDFEIFQLEINQAEFGHLDVAETLEDLSFEFEEASAPIGVSASRKRGEQRGSGSSPDTRIAGNYRVPENQLLQPVVEDSSGFELQQTIERVRVKENVPSVACEPEQEVISAKPETSVPKEKKKLRRRKVEPHDPLMEEIARELAERSTTANPSMASEDGNKSIVSGLANATRRLSEPSPLSFASTPTLMSQQTVGNTPSPMSPYSGQDSRPAPRSIPPASRPSVRKSSSFEMLEGKTPGIFGGAAVGVLLVVSFCFGWITLPFGTSGGALSGDAGVVVSCYLQYKQFGTGVPDAEEWTVFKTSAEKDVKPIVASAGDSPDKVAQAGKKLLEMAALPPSEDATRLHKMGAELDVMMETIVGK